MTHESKLLIALTMFALIQQVAVGQEKTAALPSSKTLPTSNTSGVTASNPRSSVRDQSKPEKVNLELDKMLRFIVEPNKDGATNISFTGFQSATRPIASPDSPEISQIIASEFKAKNSPSGIIIRVDKSLKYPTVLYSTIKQSLAANKINSEVYISLKNPRPTQTVQQEKKISQEYVLKNANASKVYDLIAPTLRQTGVELRLDPSRNSITANGTETRIKGFVNAMKVLDEANVERSAVVNGAKSNRGNAARPDKLVPANMKRNNSNASGNPTPRVLDNVDPIKPTNTAQANRTPTIQQLGPTDSVVPKMPNRSVNGKAIGRYQLSAVGQTVIMLDTSTGQSWFLDSSDQESMLWIPIPVPRGVGN